MAAAFSAQCNASLRVARRSGCPSPRWQDEIAPILSARLANGTSGDPFCYINVGANKGYNKGKGKTKQWPTTGYRPKGGKTGKKGTTPRCAICQRIGHTADKCYYMDTTAHIYEEWDNGDGNDWEDGDDYYDDEWDATGDWYGDESYDE